MNRDDILLLFKTEDYDIAAQELKNALKNDLDNGELIYYLFLAENKDYANIDLNNIVNEVNFNKALECSNRRLKNEFEAEFNFYLSLNDYFRKLFCYGNRNNIEKFKEIIKLEESRFVFPTKKVDFISDLDYIISINYVDNIIDFNLLALNLLYISTKSDDVLGILNQLIEKSNKINSALAPFYILETKRDIYEKVDKIIENKKIKDENMFMSKLLFESGLRYYEGTDFPQNYEQAAKLFKQAVYYGNVDAQFYLGSCYFEGKGVEKDLIKAFYWYEKAAEQGNEYAQLKLGDFYWNGYELKKDYDKSYYWYHKSAMQGNATARLVLIGFPTRENNIFEWLQELSQNKNEDDLNK